MGVENGLEMCISFYEGPTGLTTRACGEICGGPYLPENLARNL